MDTETEGKMPIGLAPNIETVWFREQWRIAVGSTGREMHGRVGPHRRTTLYLVGAPQQLVNAITFPDSWGRIVELGRLGNAPTRRYRARHASNFRFDRRRRARTPPRGRRA